jgi:hypothetical protein
MRIIRGLAVMALLATGHASPAETDDAAAQRCATY